MPSPTVQLPPNIPIIPTPISSPEESPKTFDEFISNLNEVLPPSIVTTKPPVSIDNPTDSFEECIDKCEKTGYLRIVRSTPAEYNGAVVPELIFIEGHVENYSKNSPHVYIQTNHVKEVVPVQNDGSFNYVVNVPPPFSTISIQLIYEGEILDSIGYNPLLVPDPQGKSNGGSQDSILKDVSIGPEIIRDEWDRNPDSVEDTMVERLENDALFIIEHCNESKPWKQVMEVCLPKIIDYPITKIDFVN